MDCFEKPFVIPQYHRAAPFTGFLPGMAGVDGIPMWCFYVNRGQGVCSFGCGDKNHAMMEFDPANAAYYNTERKGFRTFLRTDGADLPEPFAGDAAEREMRLFRNRLVFTEGGVYGGRLRVSARYTLVPHEPFAALLREMCVENTGDKPVELRGLDGMAAVIPYGIDLGTWKNMSNLMRAFGQVSRTPMGAALYSLRSSTEDSANVSDVQGAFFALSFDDAGMLPLICDPDCVFGYDSAMAAPRGDWDAPQYPVNKVPCGFASFVRTLEPGERYVVHSLYGFAQTPEWLAQNERLLCSPARAEEWVKSASALTDAVTAAVASDTAEPLWDGYMRQCMLDNLLRGGLPVRVGDQWVPVFSRKHGDPERDYNFFATAATFYSQGNGNFRDVCQNRRSNVLLEPAVGDGDAMQFLSLIQGDGYNPLDIRPTCYREPGEAEALTPGDWLMRHMAEHPGMRYWDADQDLREHLSRSRPEWQAAFGEGYWSDHWDYVLDLVQSYLSVYPDRHDEFLYADRRVRVFSSGVKLLPRDERVAADGTMRFLDESVKPESRWLTDGYGRPLCLSVYEKLLWLFLNKLLLIDCGMMGIETEGGRPGWNDALNGLPGMGGSSMSETAELMRLGLFLLDNLPNNGELVRLPACVQLLLDGGLIIAKQGRAIVTMCAPDQDKLEQWHPVWRQAVQLRDRYRAAWYAAEAAPITESFDVDRAVLERLLFDASRWMLPGTMERAADHYGVDGLMPTYFVYPGTVGALPDELPAPAPLPAFLEGPAKQMRLMHGAEVYEAIAASPLHDPHLGLYLTCAPLDDMPLSVGRIRAFTPGWLERESVFLHMSYKFLYYLLLSGQDETAFDELRRCMVVFQPPERYGRSPLEHVSFIASSRNPDPTVWGRGFVSRLSGSTAEALSIWQYMIMGKAPFGMVGDQLQFTPRCHLPAWLLKANGDIRFTVLGHTEVTARFGSRRNVCGEAPARYEVTWQNGHTQQLDGLRGMVAERLRSGECKRMVWFFE